MLTVRNLPEPVHKALQQRASRQGRSMEAEVRSILQAAVGPQGRIKLGSLLSGGDPLAKFTDAEIEAMNARRKASPARSASFE